MRDAASRSGLLLIGQGNLLILSLKLIFAPSFIILTSAAGRRFGVRVGGVIGGLPVLAGTILLVVALEHGPQFAHRAAEGTTLGIVALIAFVNAYAVVCPRQAWPLALTAACFAFAVTVAVLRYISVGLVSDLCIAASACGITVARLRTSVAPLSRAAAPPRWDIPLRALFGAVVVLLLTGVSSAIGAQLTGLLAAFPVVTTVLSAFTHAQVGHGEVVRLLHGFALGWFATALFCFTVSAVIERIGIAGAFGLGALVALTEQGAMLWLVGRHEGASRRALA